MMGRLCLVVATAVSFVAAQENGSDPIVVAGRWSAPPFGSRAAVSHLACSPDGAWLASGDEEGAVALWSADGSAGGSLSPAGTAVRGLAFHPAGTHVLAAFESGWVQEWEVASRRTTLRFRSSTLQTWAATYGPGGRSILTGGLNGRLYRWDRTARAGYIGLAVAEPTAQGTLIVAVDEGSPAAAAGLAVGAIIRTVGGQTLLGGDDWFERTAAEAPGRKVLIQYRAPQETQFKTAELESTAPPEGQAGPRFVEALPMGESVLSLALEPGGERILSGHFTAVAVWSLDAPFLGVRLLPPIEGQAGLVLQEPLEGGPAARAGLRQGDRILTIDDKPFADAIALRGLLAEHPHGAVVTLTFVRGEAESRVQVTLDQQQTLAAHVVEISGRIDEARWLPGGDGCLLRLGDGRVARSGFEGGTPSFIGAGSNLAATAVAFVSGGSALAIGTADGTIATFDLAAATLLRRHEGGGRPAIGALAASPDGTTLAWGGACRVGRIGLPGGDAIGHVDGPDGPFRTLAISDDGAAVVAGDGAGGVWLWRPDAGGELARLGRHPGGISALAVRPGGDLAASCGVDQTIRIYDLAAARQRLLLTTTGPATSVAFSPDGSLLGATDARATYVWAVSSILEAPEGPGIPAVSLSVSEQGLTITAVLPFGGPGTEQLNAGERILKVDGQETKTADDWQRTLAGKKAAEVVELEVLGAGGGPRKVQVTLISQPARVEATSAWADLTLSPIDLRFEDDGRSLWVLAVGDRLERYQIGGASMSRVKVDGLGGERISSIRGTRKIVLTGAKGSFLLDLDSRQAAPIVTGRPAGVIGVTGGLVGLLPDGRLMVYRGDAEIELRGVHAFEGGGVALGLSNDGRTGVVSNGRHGLVRWRAAE